MKYGFRNNKEKEFPSMVHCVITNVCNLECIHCGYRIIKKMSDFEPTFMDFEIYKKVADEIASHPPSILRFTCDGEPLLHPKILDMIEYAKRLNLRPISINTNGTLLNNKMIESLLELEVDTIEVSLNAFTKENYIKLRQVDNFDEVIDNTHNLIDLRNKKKSRTKIMVSIIEQEEVKSEINNFIKYWFNLVDKVIRRTYTSYRGLVTSEKEPFDENIKRYPCLQLWKRITVTPDGKLRFCFNDWLNKSILFDLNKDITIEKAWKSKEYERLRRLHLEGKFNQIPYCSDCTTWQLLKWDYDYEYAIRSVLNA